MFEIYFHKGFTMFSQKIEPNKQNVKNNSHGTFCVHFLLCNSKLPTYLFC
jgi:hypothetical protein